MIGGVTGKILWVDLTSGACWNETIPEWVYERYLSGMGLAAYILGRSIPPGADPLGPDNVLGFVSGLLTGTGTLMTGRWMVAARSPLTGTWGDANCGGTFAAAIKRCGYDGVFFKGVSPKPVYLWVVNGTAELRDAAGLWGKDTRETEETLHSQLPGQPVKVACIGPAGEKCSLIAGIANDGGRMAARSGLGAVMGSKRLKAVALMGSKTIPVSDPQKVAKLSREFLRWVRFQPAFLDGRGMLALGRLMRMLPLQMRQDGLLYKILLRKWGTLSMNQYSLETGDAPVKNWSGTNRDYGSSISDTIDPDRFRRRELSKYHCAACPLGCGGMARLGAGDTHKPEYETILAWSALLMNEDLESIFEINERLNRAGMDSISAGATVAFALECFENGLLTLEDTGGLELAWGNTAAIQALLERMIEREGIGDMLADGSRAAAERIGGGAAEFAVHAGGQELAMHDGRNDPGFSLHAVVEPSPGKHTSGSYLYYEMFQLWRKVRGLPAAGARFYPKGHKYRAGKQQAARAAACSQFSMVMNGAGLCLFGAFLGVQRIPVFEWLNAVTGWERSPEEYMAAGLEAQNLRQQFNLRHSAPVLAEINPRAAGQPPQKDGANRGRSVPLDELVPLYWQAMGWDEHGMPLAEKIEESRQEN